MSFVNEPQADEGFVVTLARSRHYFFIVAALWAAIRPVHLVFDASKH